MYYIATVSNKNSKKKYLVNEDGKPKTFANPSLAQMKIDFLKICAGLGRNGEPKDFHYVIEPVPKEKER